MIKLVLTDMDGTLLDDGSNLPPDFDDVIGRLKSKGVKFSPASGRQYFSLLKSFEKYKDDFIFIAENGAIAFYREKEIISFPMEKAEAVRILNSVTGDATYRVFCGKHHAYILRPQDDDIFRKEVMKYFSFYKVVDSFEEADDIPIKLSFFDADYLARTRILPKLIHYDSDYQVTNSSDAWVDITAMGVSKGRTLLDIQKMFGVEKEECAAFGDYFNDVEMLQNVGYSYAVENAHDGLKQAAKFIAPPNTDFGVTKTLRQLLDEGFMG